MENLQLMLLTIATTFIASSGFWAYLLKKSERSSATTRLIMGMANDRIITRGMTYIHQGYIEQHEYTDFKKYLYEPYKELGGNGTADRIMSELTTLPLLKDHTN